ncbi:MAG: hypothetical protein JO257_36690 [Deltaproteobacteria bacterium]|nr:hypothetical protein [Deltaproteobacteria bacterium]
MRCRGLAALAVLALVGSAHADSLGDARTAVDSSDYLAARGLVDKALGEGTASPEQLAELYKIKGTVEAALGNTAAATTAFGKWLALDPKADLPPGTSPKITRPFDAAKKQAEHREPVRVKAETAADPPSVTLVVVSDPFMMVAKARVYVRADGGKEQKLEAAGDKKIAVALPHGKRLDLRVQALDEHGNRVAELGTTEVPIVIVGENDKTVASTPPPPPGPEKTKHAAPVAPGPVHERPLYWKWWAWGGAAVAFGAGGVYFGMQARNEADTLTKLNANSGDHTFDEARAVQDRADRDATLFNVGMGVAGAFAIGATILYLTEPHAETRMAVVPQPGGGAVVVGGRF